jgi:hypothetical protein
MKWVASEIDIDDESEAPKGATNPRDAVNYLIQDIESQNNEVVLPASS